MFFASSHEANASSRSFVDCTSARSSYLLGGRRCTLAQGDVMISRKPSSELSSLYCTVINAILLLLQSPCPRNGPRAWSPYQLQPSAAADKWAIDIVKKLTHLSYIAWHGCLNECSKGGGSECSVGTTLHSHIICQQNKSSNEIHLASTRAWEASIICCRLLYIQHMNTTAMPRLHVYL